MSTETTTAICIVCTLEVGPLMEAYCNACGNLYHLRQREDIAGDDCGQVWINEDHLALEFACNNCLNPQPEDAAGSLDDILDLGEAAAAAKLDEAVLARAAELGHLRHRKTASGVLLFERRDVLAFAVAH